MFESLEEKKENKKSAIKIKNFSFFYNSNNIIINDISVEIVKGEKILILGPSGCGKSTLILCLNGIIPQVIEGGIDGSIEIDDMDVATTPVSILSQKVGIVFQDPESQFCMLKVEDEVAFGLENLMYEREKMKKIIAESLDKVEMSQYSSWLLNNLSGGMKQRVALASLLAINQDILIFDEPTSNLDPSGTREVSEIIRKLPEGKTLIVIEHKLDDFIDIFDKIILFDSNGKIIAFTTAEKLFLDFMPKMQKTGVWIPQIPKFFYSLDKEEGISFDIFPLNEKDALATINGHSESRGKVLDILNMEITKEVIRQDVSDPDKSIPQVTSGTNLPKAPVIEVENLNYKFPNSKTLTLLDINFNVRKGDFLGIVGQNGSGKTTLAKLLINLYKPDPGSKINVYKSGAGGHYLVPKDRITDITGFVFQNPEHQFVEDSVYKEITYGLKIKGMNENLINEKSDKFLKIMGLENLKDTNPFNLSQGQKRKLSVASIVIIDYEILILDEPTFGLDYITTVKLMDFLVELNSHGKSIIIITHDMNIIFKYTRDVLVLKNGRSQYFGGTKELIDRDEIIISCGLAVPPLYRLFKETKSYAVL